MSDKHSHPSRIVYVKIPSPLGTLLAYADDKGLVAIDYPGAKPAPGSSPAPNAQGPLKEAARALAAYFKGRTPLPRALIGAREGTPFQRKVWDAIERIPFGQTRGYGEIAEQIGHPGAARAVGTACGANPLPLFVPCHRVLASQGRLGGYGGGLDLKKKLLRLEGAI